jgi:hypothetical protein
MKNLIQDTIEKIKKQNIVPESRWKYLLKKYGLWLFFAAGAILTAVSLAVAFDNANNLDWDLYHFMPQNRFAYILSILPYFWIILIVIFLAITFFEIRKTETGYRYSWSKILLITLGGVAIFGIIISFFGFGSRLNSKLTKEMPFYSQHLTVTKETQWMQPSKGFLAGTILSVSEEKLEIKDLNGQKWTVDVDKKAFIKSSINLSGGEMIKLIGEETAENIFKANEIRPWLGKGNRNVQNGRMMNGSGNRGGLMRGNQK